MTPQEFAQKVKAKYPEYNNIDDAELTNRIVQKYPQYQSQIATQKVTQKPLLERAGEFVSKHNLPGSKIGENIGTSFAALKAGLEGNIEGAEAISKTAPTEKQLIGDVARSAALPVSAMVPNPASVSGAVAQLGALGGISGAGEAATEESNVARGALKGAAIGAGAGLFAKIVEKGVSLIGKAVGSGGEKITTSILKPTKPDLEDGFSIDTIKKYNLGGSLKQISQKTDEVMDDLMRQVNEKYAQSPSKLNLNEIVEKTIKESAGSKTATFGSNTSLEGAFTQLKGEVAAITEDGVVSIPEAVQVKRAAGHFGAWLYGAPDPESTARQKVYSAFYRNLKTAIEEGSPEGVKDLNKQISDLIPVMNAVIRRIPIAERNNAVSLTDIISLTGATIDPRSLSVFLLNQLSKSGRVGASMMKAGPAIQEAAGGASPLIRTAATGLQAAVPQDTQTPQQSPEGQESTSSEPITEEEARKVMDMAMSYGTAGAALGIERLGVKTLAQVAKKIHPDDAGVMRDITDFVAKEYRPSLKEANKLQLEARRIWEHYMPDYEAPKTLRGLANAFGRLLDHVK